MPPKITIPSFERNMRKGYQVLVNAQKGWYSGGWIPLNSSYGYPYEYKGFAINKCLNIMRCGYMGEKSLFCVIELKTGKTVWQSWNDYEEQANEN